MNNGPRLPFRERLGGLRRSQFGDLASDAFYVSIWQGSAAIAELVQVALIAHLLGLAEYGSFALVVAFVTLVGGFFTLRVGYTATSFGAEMIVRDPPRAAGIFQLTFLVDLATAVAGFIVIVVLAPFVGATVTDGASEELLVIGGLGLIASSPDMTFTSVLRLLGRFRLVALYSSAIELVRVALVLVGLLVFESLAAVLVAVVIGKLARGTASVWFAVRVFHQVAPDVHLGRPAIARIPSETRRRMRNMMMNTNFVAYGRLVQVQVPTLLLGGLVGVAETAIYKLGLAAASLLGRLADPASAALMPRFSRLWVEHRLADIRLLIRHTSMLSIPTMAVAFILLVFLREPILKFLGAGDSTGDAATVLVIAAAAQGLYGAVFWNRTLLFAARRAGAVSAAVCAAAVVQIAMVLLIVPSEGAVGAALAMLVSQVLVHVALTWYALRTLRAEEVRLAQALS